MQYCVQVYSYAAFVFFFKAEYNSFKVEMNMFVAISLQYKIYFVLNVYQHVLDYRAFIKKMGYVFGFGFTETTVSVRSTH